MKFIFYTSTAGKTFTQHNIAKISVENYITIFTFKSTYSNNNVSRRKETGGVGMGRNPSYTSNVTVRQPLCPKTNSGYGHYLNLKVTMPYTLPLAYV